VTDTANQYISLLESVTCNLCGSDDFDVIYPPEYELALPDELIHTFRSSGDEILRDQLGQCRHCGLQYLNPRIKQDLILEGYSEGTDETFISQAAARERTFEKHLRIIERLVPNKGRILDVGTAGGSFLGVAKSRGWDVAGCEPNRWLSEWGRQRYGINIHTGTIFDMNLDDASFDVVTLWDVLEHTPDPKSVLLECHRVLKPDGLLIVNYPDIGSSVARLMGRKWVFLLSVHLYYFTVDTIEKMLKLTGFRMINKQKYWQSLELGYIFLRMKPYITWLSKLGSSLSQALHIQHIPIPYWMGQMMVIARRK
jgi:2-polyprenyl-3-methyl-5-hydroxy-6-metoxy-1,4-benzoquinol methylase